MPNNKQSAVGLSFILHSNMKHHPMFANEMTERRKTCAEQSQYRAVEYNFM